MNGFAPFYTTHGLNCTQGLFEAPTPRHEDGHWACQQHDQIPSVGSAVVQTIVLKPFDELDSIGGDIATAKQASHL